MSPNEVISIKVRVTTCGYSKKYSKTYFVLPPCQLWANDKETASFTACQSLSFLQPEGHRPPRNKVVFPIPAEYTLFFISNIFARNARLKLAKAKQNPEDEFSLFENYSLSSSTLSPKNNTAQKTNVSVLMTF